MITIFFLHYHKVTTSISLPLHRLNYHQNFKINKDKNKRITSAQIMHKLRYYMWFYNLYNKKNAIFSQNSIKTDMSVLRKPKYCYLMFILWVIYSCNSFKISKFYFIDEREKIRWNILQTCTLYNIYKSFLSWFFKRLNKLMFLLILLCFKL